MSKILDGNPTKKAHSKVEYSEEELEEFTKCADPDDGYFYFITNYGHIKHPSRGMILYKPFNYQLKLLHVYHNYRFSISMLGRQMGKALAEDTPILTPNGFKSMKDIQIGDYVYDETGKPVEVINKTVEQLDRECYAVKFTRGETIIADAEHLWKVENIYDSNPDVMTTKEIFEYIDLHGINEPLSIPTTGAISFSDSPVTVDPYNVGVNIGKGDICPDLKDYIFNSLRNRLEILRGIMDSSNRHHSGYYIISHSDVTVLKDVKFLLSTLGITSSLSDSLLSFFYSDNDVVNDSHYIIHVEKVESCPVYCIEVDNESHLFLAGETLVPTHNCVSGETVIKVRNKETGEVKDITIEEFHKGLE